jgi:lipid-A-disaccharide synthase-like uncharacterized protein
MTFSLKLIFCFFPSFMAFCLTSICQWVLAILSNRKRLPSSLNISVLLCTSFHVVLIYTQDWDRQNPTQIVTEMCGFVTILSGTFLLHKTKDMADGATSSFLLYCHYHVSFVGRGLWNRVVCCVWLQGFRTHLRFAFQRLHRRGPSSKQMNIAKEFLSDHRSHSDHHTNARSLTFTKLGRKSKLVFATDSYGF